MPPKVRIQKEDIINAAVEIVRQQGMEALNARNVAAALRCSTQPVFSNFATMDALRLEVVRASDALCREYIRRETESGLYPAYKSAGMAYIRFARDEKKLFQLLYMRDRSSEHFPEDDSLTVDMEKEVQDGTGLNAAESQLFHLEMWAFVHGIASMFATEFLELDWELVSRMLTDAYQGLIKRFEKR